MVRTKIQVTSTQVQVTEEYIGQQVEVLAKGYIPFTNSLSDFQRIPGLQLQSSYS